MGRNERWCLPAGPLPQPVLVRPEGRLPLPLRRGEPRGHEARPGQAGPADTAEAGGRAFQACLWAMDPVK